MNDSMSRMVVVAYEFTDGTTGVLHGEPTTISYDADNRRWLLHFKRGNAINLTAIRSIRPAETAEESLERLAAWFREHTGEHLPVESVVDKAIAHIEVLRRRAQL